MTNPTAAARKPAAAQPPAPAPACGFPIGDGTCGTPATAMLPVGYASNAQPIPLCGLHAPRFLGAAVPL